jgi:hypothetical protein
MRAVLIKFEATRVVLALAHGVIPRQAFRANQKNFFPTHNLYPNISIKDFIPTEGRSQTPVFEGAVFEADKKESPSFFDIRVHLKVKKEVGLKMPRRGAAQVDQKPWRKPKRGGFGLRYR